jgi:pyruvate dehydrogenase E2 component (dihydrolipoamide acetyltransferase)
MLAVAVEEVRKRLAAGFDHRIIDRADVGKFMAEVNKYLENWSEDIG